MASEKSVNITLSEIKSILDVNEKAIEIYIEVQEQNDEILEKLEKIQTSQEDQKEKITYIHNYVRDILMKKISDIDKNIFRLLVILGVGSAGTITTAIVSIIKSFH